MARYSHGVLVVWSIAAAEARAAGAATLEPAHLMIGLSKLCDLDLDRDLGGGQRSATQPELRPSRRTSASPSPPTPSRSARSSRTPAWTGCASGAGCGR